MNDKEPFVERYISDLGKALKALDAAAIARAISCLKEARDNDRMVYICGNGGSASIASHPSGEEGATASADSCRGRKVGK